MRWLQLFAAAVLAALGGCHRAPRHDPAEILGVPSVQELCGISAGQTVALLGEPTKRQLSLQGETLSFKDGRIEIAYVGDKASQITIKPPHGIPAAEKSLRILGLKPRVPTSTAPLRWEPYDKLSSVSFIPDADGNLDSVVVDVDGRFTRLRAEKEEQDRKEAEWRRELAAQGESALPFLTSQNDVSHGTTWFQGNTPAEGSAAYLVCGKLGQQGAVSLRLVIRHAGKTWLNVSECTVSVDGQDAGAFVPAKGKLEKLPDGRIIEFLDAGFEEVRPVILAMLSGESATIHLQGANGSADIVLNGPQLAEMRKVLAAYEYLKTGTAPPR